MADITKHIANKVIAWAFTVGIIIAVVVGIISAAMTLGARTAGIMTTILIVLGIIVGLFNISKSEVKDYILFVTAMVVVIAFGGDTLNQVAMIGPYLSSILSAIMAFIMPSLIIVAIKAILNLAKD